MALKRKTEFMKLKLEKYMNSRVYKEPFQKINDYYLQISQLSKQIELLTNKKIEEAKSKFTKEVTKLETLSPLKTLSRGYCIVENDNKVISKAKDLKVDMKINMKFQDGDVEAKII